MTLSLAVNVGGDTDAFGQIDECFADHFDQIVDRHLLIEPRVMGLITADRCLDAGAYMWPVRVA